MSPTYVQVPVPESRVAEVVAYIYGGGQPPRRGQEIVQEPGPVDQPVTPAIDPLIRVYLDGAASHRELLDYIIIGAGSAGCVLASRLSAWPNNQVLLIEAGDDYAPGSEPPELLDSFAATAHSNPRFAWGGLTAAFGPRPGNAPDAGRGGATPKGRVIGGDSSINGMVAIRGLPVGL